MENSHGNWVKPPTSCTIEGTAVAMIVLSRATSPVVSISAPRTGPRSDLKPMPSEADEGVVEVELTEEDNPAERAVFRCPSGGWTPREDVGRDEVYGAARILATVVMNRKNPRAMEAVMENFPRLVFDEAHSEAWSLSPDTAKQINPVNPADASYALAGQELSRRGFDIHAHTDGPLTAEVLRPGDVLVIAHPAERGAERVTGTGSPRLGAGEIDLIEAFVRGGGGLVVLAECDQDKY